MIIHGVEWILLRVVKKARKDVLNARVLQIETHPSQEALSKLSDRHIGVICWMIACLMLVLLLSSIVWERKMTLRHTKIRPDLIWEEQCVIIIILCLLVMDQLLFMYKFLKGIYTKYKSSSSSLEEHPSSQP